MSTLRAQALSQLRSTTTIHWTDEPHECDPGALYLRLSRAKALAAKEDDAPDDEQSLVNQRTDGFAFAKSNRICIARVFVDRDRSASSKTVVREDYQRMLAEVVAGTYSHVVGWKMDRLWRQELEFHQFMAILEDLGNLTLHAVKEVTHVSPRSPEYMMRKKMLSDLVFYAAFEAHNIKIRTGRNHESLANEGKPNGGSRAFGYLSGIRSGPDARPHNSIPHPEEAPLVREAMERVLAGDGLRTICTDWNERGIRTVYGRPWKTSVLRGILTNPHIAGLRTWRGTVVGPAQWEGIITEAEHERLKLVLGHPDRFRQGPPRTYLLSGLLFCSTCEAQLVSHPSENKHRYACKKGNSGGCGGRVVVAEKVDRLIGLYTLELYRSGVVQQALEARLRETNEDGDDLLRQLHTVQDKMKALNQQLADDDGFDFTDYQDARRRLDERRVTLERQVQQAMANAEAHQLPGPEEALAVWRDGSTARRQAMIRPLIQRVWVQPATLRGSTRFDPGRFRPIDWTDLVAPVLGSRSDNLDHLGDHASIGDLGAQSPLDAAGA